MRFFGKKEGKTGIPAVVGGIAVFVLVAALYGWVQMPQTFLDPDSFYHLKMAELLRSQGIVREFPWLPYTTLAHDYADHHFLYHAMLVPFIAALGPFVGIKAATAVFGAAALTAFYALLRTYGVRWPFAFTMLLATSSSFMFRMNLAKTSSLSVTTLCLALIAIEKKKPWVLFAMAWLYVWLYGGWPIMIIVVGTFLAARAISDAVSDTHPVHSWLSPWFWRRLFGRAAGARRDFFRASEVRNALAVGFGLLAGLVFNPFFPSNLKFYWEQIVQVAVVNYKDTIGVGVEWYPFPPWRLLAESSAVFVVAGVVLVLLATMMFWDDTVRKPFVLQREEAGRLVASIALALLFLLLTGRSRRHVEYFAPFGMFAAAMLLSSLSSRVEWGRMVERLRTLVPRFRLLPAALCGYLMFTFGYLCISDALSVQDSYTGGMKVTKYAAAAAWLRANVPAGEMVVTSDWDDFPLLFLYDDVHSYMAGLDATFLYRQDPARYRAWVDITTGTRKRGIAETFLVQLDSRTAVVENDHTAMRKVITADPAFVKAYQDEYAAIYVIPR